MKFLTSFTLVVCTFVFSSFFVVHTVSAQTPDEIAAQQAQWRIELAQTEADIVKWQEILNTTKKGTASLQKEAAILNAKINEAKAFIKARNIAIAQLGQDITKKTKTIESLQEKIENSQDSLAQLIRKTNELDSYTLSEVILARKDISDFFNDADSFATINKSLKDLLDQIKQTKGLTEDQKKQLEQKQDEQLDIKASIEAQKTQVEKNEKEKQYLIQVNKTQEKTYQQVLTEQQAKASKIRAALFSLAGGSKAISFGDALGYAQTASTQTGVSPAFLLAILTQESNLGANVGKCYLTDTTTGAGITISSGKTWTNLMKPSRDVQPFLDITAELGFDPLKTVVSCPIPSAGGYGGAMGPAQFIPSTWKIFASRLKEIFGRTASPWNAPDAFMASALYLDDLGAGAGTYSSEIKAACKYYGTGGTSCSYGKSVMKLRASIQEDIDYLNQYGISRR
jgi:peptidoglycan hydrolase CwlO-like protein